MQVHRDLSKLPKLKNPVLTIGSFDGVHSAHLKILGRVIQLADEIDGESVLITFHPHPRQIIFPKDDSLRLLNSLEEKIFIMNSVGIDHLVIVPFSVEFSQQDPREYIENFLIKRFDPSYIVIGYDHRFGLNRAGNIDLLKQYSDQFEVEQIQKQELEEITISSTKVRNALLQGRIDVANSYLIRPYMMMGKVVHGDKIGHSLGYPTANIKIHNKYKLIPQEGIYACYTVIEGHRYESMMYIGTRPSIKTGKLEQRIEVNLFDFNDDIYDQDVRLELVAYIRSDMKFDNLQGLSKQLALDEIEARKVFDLSDEPQIESSNCTVAILNYNGEEYLEAYLPSVLYSCSKPTNYLVIDNASTDDSIDYLEEWHPEVSIHKLTQNYGFAGGYNKGMKDIQTKYTVILNSDVQTPANWLDPILDLMESDKSIGAVQPIIRSLEEKEKFEYAGAAGGWMDSLGYPFCRGRVFGSIEKDEQQYNTAEVFWCSGAAMVIRTELFQKMEGFDADYFAHMEEIDLCWRIKRAGYKLLCCADSHVYHLGGGTLQYESPRKTYLNFRNNLATLLKNEKGTALVYKFPLRLVLDGVAGLKFLANHQWKNMWSIVKAHFAIYGSFRHIMGKRAIANRLIKENRINPENNIGRYAGSIVKAHFFNGIRKFSELKLK